MDDKLEINVVSGGNQPLDIRIGSPQPIVDAVTSLGAPALRQVIPWGNPAAAHVRVYIDHRAYSVMIAHARSGIGEKSKVEVGGILLGTPYQDRNGEITDVYIREALPDKLGISRQSTFNFTYESWAALVKQQETEFPNLRIVGWYHTHPGFGIFYSETDNKSQKTYFPHPWRVGIVIDPIKKEIGLFTVSPKTRDSQQLPGFYESIGPDGKGWMDWENLPRTVSPVTAPATEQTKENLDNFSNREDRQVVVVPTLSPDNTLRQFLVISAFVVLLGLSLTAFVMLIQTRSELQEVRATVETIDSPPTIDPLMTLPPEVTPERAATPTPFLQFGPENQPTVIVPTPLASAEADWFRPEVTSSPTDAFE